MQHPITRLTGLHSITRILLSLLLIVSFTPEKATAQGDLMVMPKRVVLEGTKRAGELNLANIGHDTARYDITFLHYRMKEDGSMEEIKGTDSTILFADKNVRFFPRTVTLAPNEAQTVRIQLVNSGSLAEGEYRSHMYFRAVPKPNPLGEEKKSADTTTFSISLKPIYGISIPVIIRVGASSAQMGIAGAAFDKTDAKKPALQLRLTRTGNMSVYGDITVDHIAPDGKETRVGMVKGIAIYTPNEYRNTKVALNPAGVDYTRGKLHIVYQAQENVTQRNIAQTEIYLQ